MASLKLIMFGTGDFAVPTFRSLYQTRHQVVALYTQPDRDGPGRHKHANPMKLVAEEYKTPVFQPEKINLPEVLDALQQFQADLFIVAAYGQILSKRFLAIPPLGSINVHASLLPKYRGAAPINYAILKGETEAGVSIIRVESKLDAGPVLGMESLAIEPQETAGELEDRLARLGARLTVQVLDQIVAGTVREVPQDDSLATFAPKMTKEMGAIDWTQPARLVQAQIRALQPWPTPYSFLLRPGQPPRRYVIRASEVTEERGTAAPGTVIAVSAHGFSVQCADVGLLIKEIQPEGKRTMSAADFLRGTPLAIGDQFGTPAA